MADIRLAKPAAGTTQTVPSAPDGRFIFDFPADAATLTRNGDDLVLTFEDGAAIQLQGFYTTYSKEEMPSFQVDGVEISGQDFFAALGEDLMPAAGPAAGSSASRGGRYNEYGGSDLLDGLDHLGRLDIGFDGGTQLATDTVEPSPYSEVDHGVTVTPSGVGAATEVVTVYEAGLAGGSQAGEKDAPTMAGGSLSINAPDGVASIVIGGVVVFENGALTGKVVSTDEGTLSVTGYDPATGKLDFSYSLDRNTTEHVKSDPDTDTQISHTLVVTVTDTDGDSGSTTITVNVVDDAPTAVDDTVIGEEAQAQQGVVGDVLENDKTGADGLPNAVTSVKHDGVEGKVGSALEGAYGELTLHADGTYTYKLDKNVDVEKDTSVTETFTYTIMDADGDTSEATLTITIRGDEKEPVAPGEDKAKIVVDEGALPDGSGQHAVHGISGKDSFTVNLNGEDGTVTLKYGSEQDAPTITLSLINGEDFTPEWLSTNKTLTVNGVEVEVKGATQETPGGPWKIEYTYKLTGQQTHDNVGSAGAVGADDALSDSINITVTDATGDMTTGSLMVTVHDDGPKIGALEGASMKVDESGEASYQAKVDINDFLTVDAGADGEAGRTYKLTLGEGAGEDLKAIVDGQVYDIELTLNGEGNKVSGTAGGKEIFYVSVDEKGEVYLSLTRNGSLKHPDSTDPDDELKLEGISVQVTVKDGDGDEASIDVDLDLTIRDDGPQVTVTPGSEAQYGQKVMIGTLSTDYGADDAHATQALQLDINGMIGTLSADGVYTFANIGTAKIDDSGQIWFKPLLGSGKEQDYSLNVTVTDGDDDKGTASINFRVEGTDLTGVKGSVTGDDDNVLTGDVVAMTMPDLPAGVTLVTGQTVLVTDVDGKVYGQLIVDAEGRVTFKQTAAYSGDQHSTPGDSEEATGFSGKLAVTLDDGTSSSITVDVSIKDDAPVQPDKINFTTLDGKENYYDNSPEIMFTIGVSPNNTKLEALEFGADVGEDTASAATLTVKVNGAEFTIQVTRDEEGNLRFSSDSDTTITFQGPADVDKDGSLSYDKTTGIFTYTRPTADIGGTTNSYDVSLTITDADGDSATVSNIYTTVFRNPTVTDSTVTTDEGNIIMNGIPIGSGDETDVTDSVGKTAQGSITVNLDHAEGTIVIASLSGKSITITIDKNGDIVAEDDVMMQGKHGYISDINVASVDENGNITIEYTYTLNSPVDGGEQNSSGRGDSHLADEFTVTVTTGEGEATGKITANALDDAPVLEVTQPEGLVKDTAETIEIPLEKFSVGADYFSLDSPESVASIAVTVGGESYTFTVGYGDGEKYIFDAAGNQDDKLKIESTAEGGYKIVYTRALQDIADGKDDSYTFDITVTDADGDTTTGSVTVTTIPPTIDEGSKTDLQVDEDGLVHDPNSKTDAGQLVVDMHGQAGTVTIGGATVTVGADDSVPVVDDETATGEYGELTITEATWNDGKLIINYEYTLQTPYTDSDNENGINTVVDADSFQILINGESSGSITVDIVDDVPTLTVENFYGAYGEGINGTVDFDFGADNGEGAKIELSVNDGPNVEGISNDGGKTWTFMVDGQTVTLNAETGEFHYDLPASGSKDTYTFQFTVTDADGDEVSNAEPVAVEGTDLTGVKVSVTGDDDNVLTGEKVTVTIPELPAGVTLKPDQTVDVTGEDDKVYGQLVVDAEGNVRFEQTAAYSGSQHNAQGESEDATGFSGNLTVNLADGTTSSITVDVSILDDIPTISNSDMSTSVILGDSSDNLAKVDEEISFINYKKIVNEDGKPVYVKTSDEVSTTYWNGQITISAAKVTYDGDDERGNPLITAEDTNGMQLLYSSYNGGTKQYYKDNNPPNEDKENNIAHQDKDGNWYRDAPESDWGLTVGTGRDDGEIQATENTSDAVVIDLEGYAYGITINFGAFFAGKSSPDDPAAGTGYDNVSEKALITFYKDGKLVYSTVEYGTNSGEFTFNTGDIVLEGFDKVVISAVDNSTTDFPNENSDFTIQGIDFITKRDDPIIINEGKVTAKSGADGFADAYTDSYAKFDLADMVEQNGGELNGDGTSGTITVLKDGTAQTVTLELSEGSSGESILTGTLKSGEQLFTATLDKDGNWTMEQYDQFRVRGEGGLGSNEFDLVFKTEDADGDISSTTVNVPLEVVDKTTDIGNSNDTIAITGGDGVAGTVAAGDSGSSLDLADAGDDTITAAGSDSSVIVYGDVMNTDRLLYELKQLEQSNSWVMAGAVALPNYGSGTQVFQWLEANGEKLTGTDYEGWTHADTVDYMLRHAEELGYETRVDADGDFYLVKADGTVLNMDGSEAGIDLDSLTGRDGGDDVITGSSASDTIYGQEGHDTIYGGGGHDGLYGGTGDDLLVGDDKPENLDDVTVEGIKGLVEDDGLDAFIKSVEGTDADGDDRLFGGTGDDVLLGMGGDDFLDGGTGEDAIFGGAGNDIIVYDSNDYLVSGGSGIDFMVSDDSTLTLTTLLSGGKDGQDGPIVDSIEVLLKGDAALSLTSIQELADKYGIELDTNPDGQETLTLDMSKWAESTPAGDTHVFTSSDGQLTLETNLQHDSDASSDNGEMAQQVFILEHTNS